MKHVGTRAVARLGVCVCAGRFSVALVIVVVIVVVVGEGVVLLTN